MQSGGGGVQIRNKEVDGWAAKVLRLHVKLQKEQGGSGTVYLGGWHAGLACLKRDGWSWKSFLLPSFLVVHQGLVEIENKQRERRHRAGGPGRREPLQAFEVGGAGVVAFENVRVKCFEGETKFGCSGQFN